MIIEGQFGQLMVIVDKGMKLVETLTEVAKTRKLQGGRISGVGAIEQVQLGYYELHDKVYLRKTFDQGDYELLTLAGNITVRNGEPFVHLHATIGDQNFQVFGGHLFEAVVAITAEIHILPFGALPERKAVPEIGLDLISSVRG